MHYFYVRFAEINAWAVLSPFVHVMEWCVGKGTPCYTSLAFIIAIYKPLVQAAEIGRNIASSKSQTTHITLAMRHNLYVRDKQIN